MSKKKEECYVKCPRCGTDATFAMDNKFKLYYYCPNCEKVIKGGDNDR